MCAKALRLLLLIGCWALPAAAQAVEKITLHALFKNKVIVIIDGERRVLATGETSPEGVKLIAVDTTDEVAEVEIDGKPQVLKLGIVIAGFTQAGRGRIILYAETSGHFHADGLVNGVPVRFLIDTGATTIALSSDMARRVGLDYLKVGRPGLAHTASGTVRIFSLKLNSVQVGNITLHNVDAGVIEGSYPTEALLGMSFLGRLDTKRDGEKMELMQRY